MMPEVDLPPPDSGPELAVKVDWSQVQDAVWCPPLNLTTPASQLCKPLKLCCSQDCLRAIKSMPIKTEFEKLLTQYHKMSHQDQNLWMQNLMAKSWCQATKAYHLCGLKLCKTGFTKGFGMGWVRYQKLVNGDGMQVVDGRNYNFKAASVSNSLDVFFLWLYENLAEHLAETDIPEEDIARWSETGSDSVACETDLTSHPSAAAVTIPTDVKWLAPTTLHQLYNLYKVKEAAVTQVGMDKDEVKGNPEKDDQDLHLSDDFASFSTFKRKWLSSWKHIIKVRSASQHARCSTCAKLDCALSKATGKEEKMALRQQKADHLRSMLADRHLERRLDMMSEESTKKDSMQGGGRLLKIDIDGMDQAKWRCPRNLIHSKEFEKLWVPHLHLVGVIVWGVLEKYFIFPPNVPKDASCMMTVLCHVMDDVQKILSQRGVCMPEHLVVHLDNTPSENKNSSNLSLSSYLCAANRLETVQTNFHRVGHTHGPIDQRFSIIRSLLNAAKSLETPEDFQSELASNLKGARNRQVQVTVLENSYDYTSWLHGMGMHIAGLTPNPKAYELHTNHVWRVVQRKSLDNYLKQSSAAWEVAMSTYFNIYIYIYIYIYIHCIPSAAYCYSKLLPIFYARSIIYDILNIIQSALPLLQALLVLIV